METADFRREMRPDGKIEVPPEIASQIPAGEEVAVLLTRGCSEEERGCSEEERAWQEAGRRRFESAYAPDDSVYEQLIRDPPAG